MHVNSEVVSQVTNGFLLPLYSSVASNQQLIKSVDFSEPGYFKPSTNIVKDSYYAQIYE